LSPSIFEDRPEIEYTETDPQIVAEAQSRAVQIAANSLSRRATFDGGSPSPTWSIFAKSVFAFMLRDVGRRPDTRMIAGMSPQVVQDALARFEDAFRGKSEELYREWKEVIRDHLEAIYSKSTTVFESYVVGTFSEELYLDENDAKQLVSELKHQRIIERTASKFGVDILRLNGTEHLQQSIP